MLGSADLTPYDLRFRLLDIPVRVNPWFWLVMAVIGGRGDLGGAAVFVLCGFLSILVHEFGHGLSSRVFGVEPTGVVLYGMGGYCEYPHWHRKPWHRLLVLLSGPGAGFLLFALVLGGASQAFHLPAADLLSVVGVGNGDPVNALDRVGYFHKAPAGLAVCFLLEINLMWGLLNLLPIWPLDGGQIAGVLLGWVKPREATRWTHAVSIVTAAGLAVWSFKQDRPLMALWFAYFGYMNYQAIQSLNRFTRWDDA